MTGGRASLPASPCYAAPRPLAPAAASRTPGSSRTCTGFSAPSDLHSTTVSCTVMAELAYSALRFERLVHARRRLLLLLHHCPDLVPQCILEQQSLLPLFPVHVYTGAGLNSPMVRSVLMLPEGALDQIPALWQINRNIILR